MDLEAMLADQISKAVAGAIPADTANKNDVQAAIDALKAELPALVKAAVAEAAPELDRQGVGSRNMVGSEPELTLDSDPVNFLLKKAGSVKSTDEWTDAEKAVINGIWNRYMTQGMVSLSNSDE